MKVTVESVWASTPTSWISRCIDVTDSFDISSLEAAVNIEHTWIGDLQVNLTHNGQTIGLHNRTGGGSDNINETYQVNDFNAADAEGEWTLHVVDSWARDVGRIVDWGVTITSTGPTDG